MRRDLAMDGALAAYYETAVRSEPTCRVVDDIVVSAFFAARGITVRDVPGFSFENRPWRHNNQIRLISKQHALRSDKRDAQNARCHDALVRRDATGAHATAEHALNVNRGPSQGGGAAGGHRRMPESILPLGATRSATKKSKI